MASFTIKQRQSDHSTQTVLLTYYLLLFSDGPKTCYKNSGNVEGWQEFRETAWFVQHLRHSDSTKVCGWKDNNGHSCSSIYHCMVYTDTHNYTTLSTIYMQFILTSQLKIPKKSNFMLTSQL